MRNHSKDMVFTLCRRSVENQRENVEKNLKTYDRSATELLRRSNLSMIFVLLTAKKGSFAGTVVLCVSQDTERLQKLTARVVLVKERVGNVFESLKMASTT